MPIVYCAGLSRAQLRSAVRTLGDLGAAGYIIVYDEEFFTGVPQNPEQTDESSESSSTASQPQNPVTPPSSSSSSSVPEYIPPEASSSESSSETSSEGIPGVSSGDDDGPVRWG